MKDPRPIVKIEDIRRPKSDESYPFPDEHSTVTLCGNDMARREDVCTILTSSSVYPAPDLIVRFAFRAQESGL